jgi:sugar phosphate isomerase/epimerase
MAKIGVIHYNWPGFSFQDFLRYAAEIGCTHVELMCGDIWPDHALEAGSAELQQAAARVRGEVEAHGLKVSAFGAGNDFVQPDTESIEREVARMRRACEITRALGEDTVVRSEGGAPKDSVAESEQWNSMYECFTRCEPFLDELGVSLAVDNHGLITNDGDKLAALLDRINHPRIGWNMDTMNFRWLGNSLEDCNRFYKTLAPRALHVHFKDGFGSRAEYKGAALGEGEINLQYALQQLKAAGYDGVYTAEYEGSELDGTGYRKCVEWLKANV